MPQNLNNDLLPHTLIVHRGRKSKKQQVGEGLILDLLKNVASKFLPGLISKGAEAAGNAAGNLTTSLINKGSNALINKIQPTSGNGLLRAGELSGRGLNMAGQGRKKKVPTKPKKTSTKPKKAPTTKGKKK